MGHRGHQHRGKGSSRGSGCESRGSNRMGTSTGHPDVSRVVLVVGTVKGSHITTEHRESMGAG